MAHTDECSQVNEKKTLIVIVFTCVTMIAEIICGYVTNSMALLADGYHMGTHALAFILTYAAYVLARKFSNSDRFPKGTDKIGTLAGYTSSIFLGLTGLWVIIEAVSRLIAPVEICFNEAILVAIIGLLVNAGCVCVMEYGHNHNDSIDNKDYNFVSAYYHILADILTSVLAIFALCAGKYLKILCLDSFVGILGGILILRWAVSILKDTTKILIDMKN